MHIDDDDDDVIFKCHPDTIFTKKLS